MAIENYSGMEISGDAIKTKLLQDSQGSHRNNDAAFYGKKSNNQKTKKSTNFEKRNIKSS